jgi:hypothetical protein
VVRVLADDRGDADEVQETVRPTRGHFGDASALTMCAIGSRRSSAVAEDCGGPRAKALSRTITKRVRRQDRPLP